MKAKTIRITAMAVLLLAAMTLGHAQNIPITLNQGWNWISYPYSKPMSISDAMSGFIPSTGDMIKSQNDGQATYLNGRWRGTLTTFIPGQGYHYQSADGTTKTFIFGGAANDPSALPEAAMDGEFTVDANGTKVRFSPGNLQCRVDPSKASQIYLGSGGTSFTIYMPYNTYYNYSLCQMIYKASELHEMGLSAGPITGIAFESYSDNHYQREGVEIWMGPTTLTSISSTSVSTSGMTKVFSGSVTQQTGWTEMAFTVPYVWNGMSNLLVTVATNHGSWSSNSTYWQVNYPGFTCSAYKFNDGNAYDPSLTYSMSTNTSRLNTRFNGKGGVTWRFAENQWDVVGEGNANISESYTGWIDLFGWGTSGHSHGANCYQPWSTSTTDSDYQAYGDASYNLNDQTGEADWGCNPIINGGDQPNQWRTLTINEWYYMINTRNTTSGKRYAKATVNGVSGLILLPDDWKTSYYTLNSTNNGSANYTSNSITASQWSTLEQHGAVFLPAAGYRNGTTVSTVGSYGYYWTTSCSGSSYAYNVLISSTNLDANSYIYRSRGRSVRLVCQSNPRVRTIGMSGVTTTSATVNAEVDCTGSATVTERGVCYNTTGTPTVNDNSQAAGTGTGSFSAQLTNLSAVTTYHVRAYAKIGGTYRYGNELTFTTNSQLVVTTAPVTDISTSYALCGGTVSDCGQNVTARGLCWGTSSGPTLNNSYSYEGTGTGSFISFMGNLEEGVTYYVRAYATTADGTTYGNVRSFIPAPAVSHDYVDLGLPSGTLWATCNVGADAPEDYGDYFAWGEITPKDIYSWDNYKYCNGSSSTLTKYTGSAGDGLSTLLSEDDAATANWGRNWRMPTYDEWEELYNNTTVTWTQQNGVNGRLFSAANGNSLFLPAAGTRDEGSLYLAGYMGRYWSSSLYAAQSKAWFFYFRSGDYDYGVYYGDRYEGRSVRPVREN